MATKLGVSIESRLDNSQFKKDVAALKNDINEIEGKLGKAGKASDNFGKALSDAIPIALIEQAIQRTGEWAVNLQRSADAIHTSTGEYQILKTLFERSHLDEGNIKGFFDKLNAAATEAVSGNMELAASFARLGVQLKDLKTLGTDKIFEKIMGGGSNLGTQGLAIEKIFGKESITDIQNLGFNFSGGKQGKYGDNKSLEGYANNVGVGVPIVDSDSIKSMADSWSNFVLHMKELGSALAPIATLVLNIINGLAAMLSGTINTIFNMTDDILHLRIGKLGGRFAYMGAGMAKAITFGYANKAIDNYMGPTAEYTGLNKKDIRDSQGAGEAVLTGLLGGTGGIPEAAGAGLEKIGLSKLGSKVASMEAEGLISKGVRKGMENYVNKGVSALEISKKLTEQGIVYDEVGDSFIHISGEAEGMEASVSDVEMALDKAFRISKMAQVGGMAGGAYGAFSTNKIDVEDILHPEYPTTSRGLGQFGFGTMGNIGAGGPNLSFGGVYGADIQSRLLVLNEQMVNLLTQIVYNTGGKQGVNIGVINQPLPMH